VTHENTNLNKSRISSYTFVPEIKSKQKTKTVVNQQQQFQIRFVFFVSEFFSKQKRIFLKKLGDNHISRITIHSSLFTNHELRFTILNSLFSTLIPLNQLQFTPVANLKEIYWC